MQAAKDIEEVSVVVVVIQPGDFKEKATYELSGGMQQRVGCAHETPESGVQDGGSNTSLPVNFLERNIC